MSRCDFSKLKNQSASAKSLRGKKLNFLGRESTASKIFFSFGGTLHCTCVQVQKNVLYAHTAQHLNNIIVQF
jgi:hypothetical protein